jgi:hypothetical protein
VTKIIHELFVLFPNYKEYSSVWCVFSRQWLCAGETLPPDRFSAVNPFCNKDPALHSGRVGRNDKTGISRSRGSLSRRVRNYGGPIRVVESAASNHPVHALSAIDQSAGHAGSKTCAATHNAHPASQWRMIAMNPALPLRIPYGVADFIKLRQGNE